MKKLTTLTALLTLSACGGAPFDATLLETHDAGETDSQSTEAAMPDSGQVTDAIDSGIPVDSGRDAEPHDTGVTESGPPCVTDLSNIGLHDFRIAFTLTTLAGGVHMALLNQRTGCDQTSTWWDVSYIPSTATTGGLAFATDDGDVASYVIQEQAGGPAVDDGAPHAIVASRVNGALYLTVDGMPAGGSAPDAHAFGAMPPLHISTDACPGFGPTVGTITNMCITTP